MNFTVQSKFPLQLEKKIKKAVLGGFTETNFDLETLGKGEFTLTILF